MTTMTSATVRPSKGRVSETLPGTPGPVLKVLCGALSPEARRLFVEHLLGGTSAEWLATTMRAEGHRVSASSIRTYRRSLEGGVQL